METRQHQTRQHQTRQHQHVVGTIKHAFHLVLAVRKFVPTVRVCLLLMMGVDMGMDIIVMVVRKCSGFVVVCQAVRFAVKISTVALELATQINFVQRA